MFELAYFYRGLHCYRQVRIFRAEFDENFPEFPDISRKFNENVKSCCNLLKGCKFLGISRARYHTYAWFEFDPPTPSLWAVDRTRLDHEAVLDVVPLIIHCRRSTILGSRGSEKVCVESCAAPQPFSLRFPKKSILMKFGTKRTLVYKRMAKASYFL